MAQESTINIGVNVDDGGALERIQKLHDHVRGEKPFHASKKMIALFFGGVLLIGSLLLGAPESVTSKLADGIMLALPMLIGGQAWIDGRVRGAIAGAK